MIRTSLSFTSNPRKRGQSAAAQPVNGGDRSAAPMRSRVRTCDYDAPAGLFIRESSRLRYRAFESVALAVRYANEELTTNRLQSSTMEVGDIRFVGDEVRQLYLAAGYPFAHPTAPV